MRILFVLPTAAMYGDNIALLNIIPDLVSKGIEPLFLVRENSDAEKTLKKNGYSTIVSKNWLTICYHEGENKIISLLRFIKELVISYIGLKMDDTLYNQIKHFSPDIIYTNNSLYLTGLYYARKMKKKHLFHVREYVDKDADLKFWLSKATFTRCLKVKNNYNITITKDIKDYFGLTTNTKVIYDGVIKNGVAPIIHANKQKYFLYVGRLTYTKGVPMMLEAFSDFCKDNDVYNLLIAGDGIEKNTYVMMANELNIKNRVCFLGYRNDVKELMADAKALIVASRCEAFGFITAEAMYNGCIVIGSNTGGTAEQFDNIEKEVEFTTSLRFLSRKELLIQMRKAVNTELTYPQLLELSNHIYNFYSVEESSEKVFDYLCDINKK